MDHKDAQRALKASGCPFAERVIHLFIGGSQLHGAKLGETDDLDVYGVFIEPPVEALGLSGCEHFVWSTAGNERRNTAEDIDVTLYSLRRWAELAVKGNPTALHFLFAGSAQHSSWRKIIEDRSLFLSRASITQFVGFAENQLKRMTGQLGRGKKGQRPEIEAQYGFDVKAGMHAIRLLHECLELMESAHITLPRPERELLITIRRGGWSQERIIQEASRLMQQCRDAAERSPLCTEVDRHAVSMLLARVYLEHWSAEVH